MRDKLWENGGGESEEKEGKEGGRERRVEERRVDLQQKTEGWE